MNTVDLFGTTKEQRHVAYAATKARFNLKAKQRDQLDACLSYSLIMFYAHNEKWEHVEEFLKMEGII